MHELYYLEQILRTVEHVCKEHHVTKLSKISVRIDESLGFVDDSIDLYWNELIKNTIAQHAHLHIMRSCTLNRCGECDKLKQSSGQCLACFSWKDARSIQLELVSIDGE